MIPNREIDLRAAHPRNEFHRTRTNRLRRIGDIPRSPRGDLWRDKIKRRSNAVSGDASGALKSISTVSASTACACAPEKMARSDAPTAGSETRCNVNTTSSAVNGTLSCHMTPWRKWNVHFFFAASTLQEVASSGTATPECASMRIKLSSTRCEIHDMTHPIGTQRRHQIRRLGIELNRHRTIERRRRNDLRIREMRRRWRRRTRTCERRRSGISCIRRMLVMMVMPARTRREHDRKQSQKRPEKSHF